MNKIKTFTATEARKDFFKILDSVLKDGNKIYITKTGEKGIVKLESVKGIKTGKTLSDYNGILSNDDADIFEDVLKKSRNDSGRL